MTRALTPGLTGLDTPCDVCMMRRGREAVVVSLKTSVIRSCPVMRQQRGPLGASPPPPPKRKGGRGGVRDDISARMITLVTNHQPPLTSLLGFDAIVCQASYSIGNRDQLLGSQITGHRGGPDLLSSHLVSYLALSRTVASLQNITFHRNLSQNRIIIFNQVITINRGSSRFSADCRGLSRTTDGQNLPTSGLYPWRLASGAGRLTAS